MYTGLNQRILITVLQVCLTFFLGRERWLFPWLVYNFPLIYLVQARVHLLSCTQRLADAVPVRR